MTAISPVLSYPGAKWRVSSWIIEHLPPHQAYVEPFLGSGAVYFSKSPARTSVLNDINGNVVNLFRVLRDPKTAAQLAEQVALTPYAREEWVEAKETTDDPLERARRFLVRSWMSHGHKQSGSGWRHDGPVGALQRVSCSRDWRRVPERILSVVERLRDAQIECSPAVDVIRRYSEESVLVYADPPYLGSTRKRSLYTHEMWSAEEHERLLDVLLQHRGPVVLSGYASEFYESRLMGWFRYTLKSVAEHGKRREEVLWVNRPPTTKQQLFPFESVEV